MLSSLHWACLDVFRSEIIFPAFHKVLAEYGRKKVVQVYLEGTRQVCLGRTVAGSGSLNRRWFPAFMICPKGAAMNYWLPSTAQMWSWTWCAMPPRSPQTRGTESDGSSSPIVIPITTASTQLSAKSLRLSLHPLL